MPTINPAPTGVATPPGGWQLAYANTFGLPFGTGAGQDPTIWRNRAYTAEFTSVPGYNTYEIQKFNASAVSQGPNGATITATADGLSGSITTVPPGLPGSGAVTPGHTGFAWLPGVGTPGDTEPEWAIEWSAQDPNILAGGFPAVWGCTIADWSNEQDYEEDKGDSSHIDSDFLWVPGSQQEYYTPPGPQNAAGNGALSFSLSDTYHTRCRVINGDLSWSLLIDGAVQPWVGNNGIAPPEPGANNLMALIANFSLFGTPSGYPFFFNLRSIAVYCRAGINGGIIGGGLAPGTTLPAAIVIASVPTPPAPAPPAPTPPPPPLPPGPVTAYVPTTGAQPLGASTVASAVSQGARTGPTTWGSVVYPGFAGSVVGIRAWMSGGATDDTFTPVIYSVAKGVPTNLVVAGPSFTVPARGQAGWWGSTLDGTVDVAAGSPILVGLVSGLAAGAVGSATQMAGSGISFWTRDLTPATWVTAYSGALGWLIDVELVPVVIAPPLPPPVVTAITIPAAELTQLEVDEADVVADLNAIERPAGS
jgi:hypothetical protein